MLPRVDTTIRPIAAIEAPSAAAIIGSAKQEIASRFDLLEIGKQVRGEILSRLSDGTFFVKLAGATARMTLPANSKVGEYLPLTLLALTPRPTFLLETSQGSATTTATFSRQDLIENFIHTPKAEFASSLNKDAMPEVSESYVLETEQSQQPLSLPSNATTDTPGNVPIEKRQVTPVTQSNALVDTAGKFNEQIVTNADSAPTNFSDTGKLINKILLQAQQQGAPSSLIGKTPLFINSDELKHPVQVAKKLQQILSSSGIFYESHVADWAEGKLSLVDLKREPQAHLSNATTNFANTTAEDQFNLAQIIHLQLDALEQQKIAWQGQLLPNVPFHWTITQQDHHTQTTLNEPEPGWQSVVRFELPNLGVIAATIKFHAGQLQLFLSTETEETVSQLKEHSFELSQALENAGAPLKSFLVKRDEQV